MYQKVGNSFDRIFGLIQRLHKSVIGRSRQISAENLCSDSRRSAPYKTELQKVKNKIETIIVGKITEILSKNEFVEK